MFKECSSTFASLGGPPVLDCSLDPLWGQLRLQSGPAPSGTCLQCSWSPELGIFLLCEYSLSFYVFRRHRVYLVDYVDLICSLYGKVEMFSILFLSRHAPGARLWFYLHLCIWVIHRSLLLRLPWRTWVCFSEDQACSWHSSLDHGDHSSARYTEEPVATGSGDMVLSSV